MSEYRTPLPALFAASLQSGLNGVLALDANSATRLQRLKGKVLKLVLDGTGIELFFTGGSQGIEVSLDNPHALEDAEIGEANTTVRGTPAALFSMAASQLGEGWSAPGSAVSIAGDAGLARDFERLFSRLDPDIDGAISSFFGDVLGHQFAFGLKQSARRARETASAARDVLGEVLRDGSGGNRSGPLVGRAEARHFADEVDRLRDAVERLEARLRVLARKREPEGDGRP